MGYHVRIVNINSEIPNSEKILYDIQKLETKLLSKFGFVRYENEKDGIFFFNNENEEFILFYELGELWANTTNDMLIDLMTDISKSFNDGSVVVGDLGEIDGSLDSSIKEDSLCVFIKKIINFFISISIPIVLAILAYFLKL